MKKIAIIVLAFATVITACMSKRTTTSSKESVTDAQLEAVKIRFPDATKAELEKGYAVFTGPCTKCHRAKDITGYPESKLLDIVDAMAKKAKITPEEKQALIRFAVGVRATK